MKRKVLLRQLKRMGLTETSPPSPEQWHKFLEVVQQVYENYEQDRYLIERSLEISSKEMKERWDLLQKSQQALEDQRAKTMSSSKMASLGEMSAGIAHEINNPLAVIKTLAEQVEELLAEENIKRDLATRKLQTLVKTTDRIAKIIQGLRSFSREAGQDPFQTVFVKSMVEDTLSLCQERCLSHGVQLIVEEVGKDLAFQGRSVELSQVVLNLINNAHDAVERLSEKWICISISVHSENIQLRVIDSGHGIPVEVVEKLFHPFFTTKEVGRGTGLGLSVSQGIVRNHGGTLHYELFNGHTCFVITLPRQSLGKIAA